MKQRLRTFSQAAGPHDDLFVFVAGHGHLDPIDRAGSLVLSDASPDCRTGCYPFDHLKRTLYDVRARHVLVTLDTCYAGTVDVAVTLGGEPMRSGPPSELTPPQVPRLLRDYEVTPSRLLFASTSDRPVSDGAPGGHSPFMRVLLRELAAPGPSGVVTLDRLYAATQREPLPSSAMRPAAFPSARPHHPNGTYLFIEDTDLCRSLVRLTDAAASDLSAQSLLEPTRTAFGTFTATRGGLPGAADCRLWRLDNHPPMLRCEYGEASPELAFSRQNTLSTDIAACLPAWPRKDLDHTTLETRSHVFTSPTSSVRVSTVTVCENRCTVSVTIEP